VAAASGYSSIENYVPYVMWSGRESLQEAVLQSSRNPYKHELYLSNLARTPTLIQHGQCDDNVPVYHGRLISSLAARAGVNVSYVEVPGRGHWWDDVMVTDAMTQFFNEHLRCAAASTTVGSFSCIVGNSHEFGSCNGIVVEQLKSPDALGRVHVEPMSSDSGTVWHLVTENVRRLSLDFTLSSHKFRPPHSVTIDNASVVFSVDDRSLSSYCRFDGGDWAQGENRSWQTLSERFGDQRGSMSTILKTKATFQIICDPKAFNTAIEISRNLLQYYGAAADLKTTQSYQDALESNANVILIQTGDSIDAGQLEGFPIHVRNGIIRVRGKQGLRSYNAKAGIGAAWVRPLPNERLELIIWGFDAAGLRKAARMAPTLTGAGQPDFVVFDTTSGWEGSAGTLAMGFFDHSWNISAGSYLR
jgi:hypothetical protein